MKTLTLRCAWQALARVLSVLAFMATTAGGAARAGVADALQDLPPEALAKVSASVNVFLSSTRVKDTRSANDLGWDCLAALEMARLGEERALKRIRAISNELAKDALRGADGKVLGWTASIRDDRRCPAGGYDAFGDGTCNSVDTVYALQSGLALACLAKASKVLQDDKLGDMATESFASWKTFVLPASPCPGCVYFATSNSPNDANRYVRNMNVFVALGGAALAANGSEEAASFVQRAMQSEMGERQAGNRGYLGRLDPQWKRSRSEADRIENHAAAVAVSALQMGEWLGTPEYRRYGQEIWMDWARCDNDRCRKATCNYWAADPKRCQATQTAAHCAFRSSDPAARDLCLDYLSRANAVGSFGILSLLLGRAEIGAKMSANAGTSAPNAAPSKRKPAPSSAR